MKIIEITNSECVVECEDDWEQVEIINSGWMKSVIMSKKHDGLIVHFIPSFIKKACKSLKREYYLGTSVRLIKIKDELGNTYKPVNFLTCKHTSFLRTLDGDQWCSLCGLKESTLNKFNKKRLKELGFICVEEANHYAKYGNFDWRPQIKAINFKSMEEKKDDFTSCECCIHWGRCEDCSDYGFCTCDLFVPDEARIKSSKKAIRFYQQLKIKDKSIL